MPNMTLAIPEDLKKKMDLYREINWSEVARQAIQNKMMMLDQMSQMLSKTQLTAADVAEVSYTVKKRVAKKHRKYFESIAGIAKTNKSLVQELLEERAREKEREDAKWKKNK